MEISKRFEAQGPYLSDKLRRVWAAAEADAAGCGGVVLVAQATGISRRAIAAGKRELAVAGGSPRVLQAIFFPDQLLGASGHAKDKERP